MSSRQGSEMLVSVSVIEKLGRVNVWEVFVEARGSSSSTTVVEVLELCRRGVVVVGVVVWVVVVVWRSAWSWSLSLSSGPPDS